MYLQLIAFTPPEWGGGVTDADVRRVEALIRQGISSASIEVAIDGQLMYAKKDALSQSRAIKQALDNVEHNLSEVEKERRNPRPKEEKEKIS